ncbi:MAG: sigma-54-dependent Fis family transcriptional regulator [Desulfamplus sp.]|nr:sigma-54-dependent Fis family transcriptional regulator [Desulfamplus sp.]
MNGKNKILVVDDDASHRTMLKTLMTRWGYEIHLADDGSSGVDKVHQEHFDIVLMDMKMLKMSGMEALEKICNYNPALPVIIMTAYSSIETAVEALKNGAYDYMTKPLDFDKLKLTISHIIETIYLKRENIDLKKRLNQNFNRENIIGKSPAMTALLDTVELAAPSDANILIIGGSGTGKELIASAIHYNSPRKDMPFIRINCAAITETLLESELFGHEKGSFTGADKRRKGRFLQAHGGSILLDEIGEMSLAMQAKLLRVLQEKEITPVGSEENIRVDVRVIASTNRDLKKMAADGRFRDDLYFRLNVVTLEIPPLSYRSEDIPSLALHFLKLFSQKNHRDIKGFTPEAMDSMIRYGWPGNVRELMNSIERAVVLARSDYLSLEDFPFITRLNNIDTNSPAIPQVAQHTAISNSSSTYIDTISEDSSLVDIEREAVLRTLESANGNRSETARRLGITRKTLLKKLRLYGKA